MTDIPKLLVSPNASVSPRLTARREPGYDHQWVVRERNGSYVDRSPWRDNLMARHDNLEIIDE